MDDDEYNIPVGNYTITKQIGVGAFSSVWIGENNLTGVPVAVKIVPKSTIETPESMTRFQREISLEQKIYHPLISQFYEMIEDQKYYYIFMEYADNGDLATLLEDRGQLNENMCRFFFVQLLLAIDYLHNELRIVHRDLKPQNVLLDRYNNIRLTDFGLSNTFSDINPVLNTGCGSPAFVAPEIAMGKSYTKAADIWSLGVMLYEMATAKLPFEGDDVHSIMTAIVHQEPVYPMTLSGELINLLKRMLCKSPEQRITIKEIRQHEWVCPAFIQAMTKEINEVRQENEHNSHAFEINRDPQKLQTERSDLIEELYTRMSSARTKLPTTIQHIPPNSLPPPQFEAFKEAVIAQIQSNTNPSSPVRSSRKKKLKASPSLNDLRKPYPASKTPPEKPIPFKRSQSSYYMLPKRRSPIKVPRIVQEI